MRSTAEEPITEATKLIYHFKDSDVGKYVDSQVFILGLTPPASILLVIPILSLRTLKMLASTLDL